MLNNKLNIVPLGKVKSKPLEFVSSYYLPFTKKTCTLVVAPGDTGKTFIVLLNALYYKLEQIKSEKLNKCFCWFSEDDCEIVIKNRELALINFYFNDEEKKLLLDEKYDELICVALNPPFAFMHLENQAPTVSQNFLELRNHLKDFELIVLDPLSNFNGADENNNFFAKQLMNLLDTWASSENKAVVILHNTPSGKVKARGAEAIRDAAKTSYLLKRIVDKDGEPISNSNKLEIVIDKDNYNIKSIIEKTIPGYQSLRKSFRLDVFPKEFKKTKR